MMLPTATQAIFLAGVEGALTAMITEEMIITGCTAEQALAAIEKREGKAALISNLSRQSFDAMLLASQKLKAINS